MPAPVAKNRNCDVHSILIQSDPTTDNHHFCSSVVIMAQFAHQSCDSASQNQNCIRAMTLAARFSGSKASASSRGLWSGSASLRTRAAKICLAVAISWGSGLPFAGSAGRCQPRANRSGAGRAAEDTMGELFTKYYRLQEVNRNLEADTKVAVVSELLEVLDDLERGASQDGSTGGVSTLRSLADKFQSRLESLGFERIKAMGAVFDPAEHEAASQRAAEGQAEGTVCEELRSGWKLSDRIVRPSVVIVAS
ncbi:Protein GrpE [Symbiodinium microadriaticum]|uniref:Protein GrpE n=1 Tax=Symbiodinium microadriaticum TaxID=2951 RepID=A0A1Q9CJS8_SYMMI|nr:Protein GrpE [Symbiodinium microadriaticum]CAE7697928.1 grpE [Symbiodinium microadriaticum]